MSSKPNIPTKSSGDTFSAQELNTIVDFFQNKPDADEIPEAIDGKSAYQLAVDNGFVGTEQEWLESLSPVRYMDGDIFEGDGETPETKTTIKDGSIGEEKLSDEVRGKLNVSGLFHRYIAEDRARRKNVDWVYTGAIHTVGSSGTYATISAAISAAASGDIIQLEDGEYPVENEPSGYLFLNNATKRLLIRGNQNDRNAVVIKRSTTANYCILARETNEVTFQDLRITSSVNQSTVIIPRNTRVSIKFKNCEISHTGTGVNHTVWFWHNPAYNGYYEFDVTDVISNGNAASRPFHTHPLNDAEAEIYSNPILITKSKVFGWTDWGDNAIDITMYDTAWFQNSHSSSYVFAIGSDIADPVNSKSKVDIRSCKFELGANLYSHPALLGRGCKNVYFVNNSVMAPPSTASLALGIVVKCDPDNLGDVVVDGNYSLA